MDPPVSHRVPRAPCYSGTPRPSFRFTTGLSPSVVRLSRRFTKQADVPHWRPQPPPEGGFGLFRFRSPLLTESRLLSFPPGTEMFQFPGFASAPYTFRCRFPTSREGCPIRRSQSQCSVTSSSGLFAGSHVLHRLSTPRHPPHALINFVTPTRPRPEHRSAREAQTTHPEGSHRPAKSGAFKLPLLLSNSFARQERTC